MLRRDEICGDLGPMMQDYGLQGRSNKFLISQTGAAGLEPATGAPVEVPV
jgi:hypothetical protein